VARKLQDFLPNKDVPPLMPESEFSPIAGCNDHCNHLGDLAIVYLGLRKRYRVSPKLPAVADSVVNGLIISEERPGSRLAVRIPAGTGKLKAGMVLGRLCPSLLYASPDGSQPCPLFVPSPAFKCAVTYGSETASAVLITDVDAEEIDAYEEVRCIDGVEKSTGCFLSTEPILATAIIGGATVRRSALHFHKGVSNFQAKIEELSRVGIKVVP
jgi:hypothetical protein